MDFSKKYIKQFKKISLYNIYTYITMPELKTYDLKTTKQEDLHNAKKTTYQLNKKDKSFISATDITYLTSKLTSKLPKGSKILIRGLGVHGVRDIADRTMHKATTLKGYNDQLLMQDEEQYLSGRVNEATRFLNFFQIEFTIIRPTQREFKGKNK
jgi:hypothetical protein